MALPASGPISGSQIATELGLSFTNLSLGGMIDSSSLSNTDPDAYSDFYGYSGRDSSYRYASTVGKPAFECDISRAITTEFWHDGSFGLPTNGDQCWTSPSGSNYLANGNYSINNTSTTNTPLSVIIITGGSGIISSATICGLGGI